MTFQILRRQALTEEVLRQWAAECSSEKRAQLRRLLRREDQIRCLCADHLARAMLSEQCGIAPEALTFAREKNGKPYVSGVPVFFNVSHSGDFVACAVDEQPVGIDIEARREVRPALANKICTGDELTFVTPAGCFDSGRFLQLWTVKEAYLKQSGAGIRCDLRKLYVVQNGRLVIDGIHLHSELTAEYALSVAFL